MLFSRNFFWLIFGLIPFFLANGCGDLELEMQDTRSVVLKMNFNQRSSLRNSQVTAAEVSSYKTHLILALPSWEELSSDYMNYYNSFFAVELMNPSENKVSLEIPLNTQMKIFAFIFSDEYTSDQLISGVSGVSYYGESPSFSIGASTHNLSLGVTLQTADTSEEEDTTEDSTSIDTYENEVADDISSLDTTAPTVSLTPDTITSSDFAVVQSSETGTVYLINTDVTVSNITSISEAADNMTNSVVISAANTDTNLTAAGLVTGTYKAYAVDVTGNLSDPSSDNVSIGELVDIDGNVYSTVVIGTQHWMAENLKVTKYRNGDNITHITTDSDWTSDTDGAYGYYDNSSTNLDTYGMLYNWYAVDNSTGQNICPQGWHVPTATEFSDLATELGSNVAGQLKETGTVHWSSESTGTSNSSGFTALPAGLRVYYTGGYSNLGNYTYFWTSTSSTSSATSANYKYLTYSSSSTFVTGTTVKTYGFSVRCLKD